MFEHLFLDGYWSDEWGLLTDGFGRPTEGIWEARDNAPTGWTRANKTARTWSGRDKTSAQWRD